MNSAYPTAPAPRASGFIPSSKPTAAQAEAQRAALAAKAIRPLPYPFGSAMAFVSDIDASCRPRYAGYVGQIVGELGLDFGDSTWLHWQYTVLLTGETVANAFGFFNPSYSMGRKDDPELFSNTRTFNESVAEFHAGNVDHFHAYSSRGPRVVLLTTFTRQEVDRVEIDFDQLEEVGVSASSRLFVLGVCVAGVRGQPIEVKGVTALGKEGAFALKYEATAYVGPPNGREHKLFTIAGGAEDEVAAPILEAIQTISIILAPGDGEKVERVMLVSCFSSLLIDRLRMLRDRFGVGSNLVTEHGRFHFRGPASTRLSDAALSEDWRSHEGPPQAYSGTLVDDDGTLVFSTDAAEPHSFGRVFPEVSRELELRFVNPVAATRSTGWDPIDLVTPSPMACGAGVYWAHRTLRNIGEPLPGKRFDGVNSRQDTLVERLTLALDDTAREPGLFWPLYTHLGSWTKVYENTGVVDIFDRTMPSPYFEPGPMLSLQDRVFAISGSRPERERVWFTRASVIYDYALMIRGIGEHVSRLDADTVIIESWMDEALDKRLPRSPTQLYGLTFYVDDPVRAEVRLDGEVIESLVRNSPDETGRASVTVAECDIRNTIFDQLDPLANDGGSTSPIGGQWTWHPRLSGAPAFGRLEVASTVADDDSGGDLALLAIPLRGWCAAGAQLARLKARRHGGVRFGVVLETETGAAFFIGDREVAPRLGRPVAASYFLDRHDAADGSWSTIVTPFYDLGWSEDCAPGGPMPSHPLKTLTLACAGPPGAAVDLAGLALLRPRTSVRPGDSDSGFCVGGQVEGFAPGQAVQLSASEGANPPIRSVSVDQCGWFCYEGVRPGVYRLWSATADGEMHDRRGPLIEVGAHLMSLVLSGNWRSVPAGRRAG